MKTFKSGFETKKQYADGTHTRVWNADTLCGSYVCKVCIIILYILVI